MKLKSRHGSQVWNQHLVSPTRCGASTPPTKVSTPQPNNPGVRSGRGKGSPQRAQLVRRVLPLSGRALPTSPSPLQTPGHLPTGTMWCGVSPAWLWGL